MNFCELGDPVIHPKLGTGRVTKLLGSDGDDGVRIKLDSGRSIDVKYTGDSGAGGWKRYKPATAAKQRPHKVSETTVKQLLGEVAEATAPNKMTVVKLHELPIDHWLSEAISEVEEEDAFLVSVSNLVENVGKTAQALASQLASDGVTHIYTG
jgi:hypothetical protein